MKHYFDWDQWNIQKSFLKHGITNEEAESVFDDINQFHFPDLKHSLEEERYICIAKSCFGRILYTAYTFRNGKIRIISTRLADQEERQEYGN